MKQRNWSKAFQVTVAGRLRLCQGGTSAGGNWLRRLEIMPKHSARPGTKPERRAGRCVKERLVRITKCRQVHNINYSLLLRRPLAKSDVQVTTQPKACSDLRSLARRSRSSLRQMSLGSHVSPSPGLSGFSSSWCRYCLSKAGRRQSSASVRAISSSGGGSVLCRRALAAMDQRTPEIDTTELWKPVAQEYQRTSAEHGQGSGAGEV